GLRQAGAAPGNPIDQLASARASFDQALAAYTASPTTGGLSQLQQLAQTVLQLAEPIYSRPSGAYQDIFNQITGALENAADVAAQQVPIDQQQLDVMTSQLTALDNLNTIDQAIQAATVNLQSAVDSGNADQIAQAQAHLTALQASQAQLE